MKPTNQQWNQICDDYLAKIERTLQGAAEHERRQILDEVTFHLNKRFKDLNSDEQTWENMQKIITEMGPVEDYAELLEEPSALPKIHVKRWAFLVLLVVILLVIASVSLYFVLHHSIQITPPTPQRPVVVETLPQTLQNNVNPDTTEISVTFDQPMMNFSWSWVGGGENYPETTGKPKYDKERKSCTLPVKLKPNHWYWIGINSEYYVYFQTEKHVPAKPYVILFATADEHGNPTEIPTEYIEEAKRINSK